MDDLGLRLIIFKRSKWVDPDFGVTLDRKHGDKQLDLRMLHPQTIPCLSHNMGLQFPRGSMEYIRHPVRLWDVGKHVGSLMKSLYNT